MYSTTRAGDEPGILTLRSAGNLTFNGSLSDGFTNATFAGTTAGTVGVGESSSYRLVAGADTAAANLLSTNKSANTTTGNVILGVNKGIRTGTGDIEIAAGGELRMGTGSTIYTAGVAATELIGFDSPPASLRPTYLTQGGDVNINVQGNIVGNEINAATKELINQWLFRQAGGSLNRDASWWVRPDLFRQGTATLGGGDIDISAGGSIANFSASAPTTSRFDNFDKTEITTDVDGNAIITIIKATGNQVIDGGGDVIVKAGVDINNGVYFVAKGDGEISAGKSIKKDGNFGTILALQDGNFNVTAGEDILIEAIINPTLVSQSTVNASTLDTLGANAYFNSYSSTASASIASLNGNVQFGGGSNILAGVLPTSAAETLKYAPGNLNLTAFNGDVALADIVMMPLPTGDLKVLAANNVKLSNLTMSDADVALLPNVNNPLSGSFVRANGLLATSILGHDTKLLHRNNPEPNMIVARNGDIDTLDNSLPAVLVLPKLTMLVAGGDIKNVNLVLQNNNVDDVSLIKAGQDITTGNITVAGPGELLLQASRNIDLSITKSDISSTGNSGSSIAFFQGKATPNPALPVAGASVTLQAGLGQGANVQGYVDQYILPTGAGPKLLASDAIKLSEYRTATNRAITDYMLSDKVKVLITDKVEALLADGRNIKVLTPKEELAFADIASDLFKEALPLFTNASFETKTIFANRHLTSELIESARGFAKAGNHDRGNDAIATLFPTKNAGDILLFSSKVSTNSGGSIDLIAPSGLINVGAPGQAFKDTLSNTGEIGTITEKGGAIRAIANGDFQVNQSKVITQFGSDIAIWSSTGTIDAGRGSKSATSIPERIVQTDVDGNTTVEVRGVAAGSGIRAQSYDPDGPNGPLKEPLKGRVFLTAPRVDAGEAGIEAGDLFIVAPIVLNATNIQVQGASSGVPIAATAGFAGAGVSATPDAVNAATASVAQSVAQSVNQSTLRPVLPSLIYVDVISIGK